MEINVSYTDLFEAVPDSCFADLLHTNACGNEIIARSLADYVSREVKEIAEKVDPSVIEATKWPKQSQKMGLLRRFAPRNDKIGAFSAISEIIMR